MVFLEWFVNHSPLLILGAACGWSLSSARRANTRISDLGITHWQWQDVKKGIEEFHLKKYSTVSREYLQDYTCGLFQRIAILETKLEERTGNP
jgi:hypothetical protein